MSQIVWLGRLHVEPASRLEGEMTNTTRVPKAELTGVYGAMVKRFSTKMLGEVAEPAEVMWHNRKVLKGVMAMGQQPRKWDQCDPNLKSFAHMAVAALVGCSWCLDFGYFEADNQNLDVAKASQVPRWRDSEVFTPLERDVMEYAEAMSQTPPTVTDELSGRLLAALGAPAMIELTAWIAYANQVTRTNTALGIESQGFSAACEIPLATSNRGAASTS
jgi:alkylhydroperoxidase family enzyme